MIHFSEIIESLGDPDCPEYVIASAKRLAQPWIVDRLALSFTKERKFNTNGTVKPDVFPKLLYHLTHDDISINGLVKLFDAFMAKVSQEDWENFYKPVLACDKNDVTVPVLNRRLNIEEIRSDTPSIITSGIVYPISKDWMKGYLWLQGPKSCITDEDLKFVQPYDVTLPKEVYTHGPMMVEIWIESDGSMVATDCVPYLERNTITGNIRKGMLEMIVAEINADDLTMGDDHIISHDTIGFVKSWYNGLGYRDYDLLYKPNDTTYKEQGIMY